MDEETIKLYKRNKAAMIVTLSPAVASAKLPTKMTKMTQKQQEASKLLSTYCNTRKFTNSWIK